jgi:peptidoglycan/xylan/chitin deacetylase (PgdA/CDA1 family)
LDRYKIKTTFFIVSEIFNWHPDLIYKIKSKGHELGFQSHTHRLLKTKKILKEELRSGQEFLEEFGPEGFRAPQGFIKKEYLSIIKDWGFKYDSSIYAPFNIYEPLDNFIEVPVSTYPLIVPKDPLTYPRDLTFGLMVKEVPFGSGYYIGLLGKNVQWFIKRLNKRGTSTSIIIHSWQIKKIPKNDIKGIKLNKNILISLKMLPYELNRKKAFETLLKNNEFIPMIEIINKFK